ncbi:SDR family NAD(P)-dependent oxidoreductase [Sphingobium sp.]|uniref:SDR family NAD(P)-dependent oxidoreductase n=1 Tax=Sphingobium sp. TaxID=1912891 RepID=UPI0028BDDB31|nr:SDR family oxidoreductase [Sphingobium sp.]
MSGRLEGKAVLITGAASGLGAETARLFARQGARVAIADVLGEPGNALAAEIGGEAFHIHCDVTSEDSFQAAIDAAADRFGGLDVLFANAGGAGTLAPIAQMDEAGWDAVMALIPRAAMFGMKHALPHLRTAGGGSIMVTASIAGLRPGVASTAYSVAKAAVLQLVQMAAAEFSLDRVRVNAISPGIVPTPGITGFFGVGRDKVDAMLPQVSEIFGDAQLLPRAGTPLDIANMALFLASDEAGWITGQNFVVDGGMMAMGPASLDPSRADGVLQRTMALAGQFRD